MIKKIFKAMVVAVFAIIAGYNVFGKCWKKQCRIWCFVGKRGSFVTKWRITGNCCFLFRKLQRWNRKMLEKKRSRRTLLPKIRRANKLLFLCPFTWMIICFKHLSVLCKPTIVKNREVFTKIYNSWRSSHLFYWPYVLCSAVVKKKRALIALPCRLI